MQVSEAAWDLLSVMDEQAALANQKIDLFTSQERFPGVFEARANLAAADAALVSHSNVVHPDLGVLLLIRQGLCSMPLNTLLADHLC